MKDLHATVGCCGWTEAQSRYVTHFPVVEIQTTFYQPPGDAIVKRWKSLSPPGFHFCMKAWQLITHTPSSPTYRRLKQPINSEEHEMYGNFRQTDQVWLAWERTREVARLMDARVIVFQCPKSFLPTPENIRNLSIFFRAIDRDGRRIGWEPRGEEWRPELVRGLCSECNLIHIVDPFEAEEAC